MALTLLRAKYKPGNVTIHDHLGAVVGRCINTDRNRWVLRCDVPACETPRLSNGIETRSEAVRVLSMHITRDHRCETYDDPEIACDCACRKRGAQ